MPSYLEGFGFPPLEAALRTSRGTEIEAYADAMADMFCAYLRGIENG